MYKGWIKKIGSVIFIFVLMAAIAVGLVLIRQKQEYREKAAPSTSLYISPSSQTKQAGESLTFSVVMNTAENQVTGFDLEINFNPAAVQIDSIGSGSGVSNLDQQIRNSVDNTSGRVLLSKFTLDSSKAVKGEAVEVMTVQAHMSNNATVGSYNISFGGTTAVSAISEGQNVVIGTTPGVVELAAPATPIPTETPSPNPTPISIHNPVGPEPTATPTLTPTPSQAPTAVPTQASSGGSSSSGSSSSSSSSSSGSSAAPGKKGDINGDGKVNITDLSVMLSFFNKGAGAWDLNSDGKVNIMDLSILLSNWGK